MSTTSPPPFPDDLYDTLANALSPAIPCILEIDILPSLYLHASPFLIDGPSLAISKPALIHSFLIARSIFFAHLSNNNSPSIGTPATHDAALIATSVILLLDPNHLTAANFRKRSLLALQLSPVRKGEDEELVPSIRRELMFMASLLTSPLIRHSKSSTLWGQRYWVVRTFVEQVMDSEICSDAGEVEGLPDGMECLWRSELLIVKRAGERHPRNYYAWLYARRLYWLLGAKEDESASRDNDENHGYGNLALGGAEEVHKWCLQHPRDISGWTFLIFLLKEACVHSDDAESGKRARKIIWETREFVRKFEWKGQSVDWTLDVMHTLEGEVRSSRESM
ncbi:hypothetical protein MMC12_002099 [Toensbergia leucococca]|nr:hypothetical protein [Toensbergia leucococca]